MLSCQCKTSNGSGVAHKRQRFGISQQKKSIWFFWFTMCRALYYFPPLSTPSNSRVQSSDQWPSNFLSHASSLDLCVIIVIVILFHLQTSVRLCTITIILHYFFSVRLRHHLYSYCHRLWTHSFCSPFCPLLPFNAFCLDFLTRHVYSLFTPQRIPKQSIPFI